MDQIVDQPDVLLENLLSAIGKADVGAAERAKRARELRLLKALYEQQIRRITTVESGRQTIDHKRELLQKLLAKKAEVRDLRNQLGERGEDIHIAGMVRMNKANLPLEEIMEQAKLANSHTLEKLEESEALNIKHLLDTDSAKYKKSPLRMHLIEPFLVYLHVAGVVPHRDKLPLSRIMEALFDWVDIDRKRRPTNTGVRTIARDVTRLFKKAIEREDRAIQTAEDASNNGD
jgi:hypothetical protein